MSCVNIRDEWRLSAQPSVVCFSKDHVPWAVVGILGIVFWVFGIPTYLSFDVRWLYSRHINKHDHIAWVTYFLPCPWLCWIIVLWCCSIADCVIRILVRILQTGTCPSCAARHTVTASSTSLYCIVCNERYEDDQKSKPKKGTSLLIHKARQCLCKGQR